MLCEKYSPNTLNGIVGNRNATDRLMEFGMAVHSGKKVMPMILYGPSGVGKTAAVHALAYSNNFELLELNASDYRDVTHLGKILLPASRSRGLFSSTILIFLDEIDELSGKFDAGAEKVILELVKSSRQPVIFAANDFWSMKISFLRNLVDRVEFKKPAVSDVQKVLANIASREGGGINAETVDAIARRSNGDIRGAINDLEAMTGAVPELFENLGVRDRKVEVFGVLDKIFSSGNFDISRNAVMKSDLDMEMLMNWIDENVTKRYPASRDIAEAYSTLAVASKFLEKASRTGYYGYLRYANILLSSGVSLSNSGSLTMLRQYSFPSNIRYLSSTKKERSSLAAIAEKLGPMLHTNKRRIIESYLPLLGIMFSEIATRSGEGAMESVAARYGISEGEAEFILDRYGRKVR